MQTPKVNPGVMNANSKKDTNRGVLIIVGIIFFYVILIIGLGVWFFNKYDWNQIFNDLKSKLEIVTDNDPEQSNDSNDRVTNSTSTIINNTVRNTYATNTVGIQFEYPAEWEVEEYPLEGDYQLIIQPINDLNGNVVILSSRNTTCSAFYTEGYSINPEADLGFINGFPVSVYDKERMSDRTFFRKIHVSTNTRCYEIQLNNYRTSNDYSTEFSLIVNSIEFQY